MAEFEPQSLSAIPIIARPRLLLPLFLYRGKRKARDNTRGFGALSFCFARMDLVSQRPGRCSHG
jgi:hypothetical protein